jgi:hypothetical protein
MTRTIRFKSAAVYSGENALDIVEQMRQADFDPPPTVRDYVTVAKARASSYFGVTLRLDPHKGTEAELAEAFLSESIRTGFAQEEKLT